MISELFAVKPPYWIAQGLIDDLVNIGSGNGLVPSGYKPLPELMLIKFYYGIWCHLATMS